MRAAHSIWKRAEEEKFDLTVAAIPKTMDNDVLWVWQSFGFLSAVERAKEMVLQLHTEVSSNPRLGIMQLFGSDSGFVVSHAALGSDVCDYVMIPEVPFTLGLACRNLVEELKRRLEDEGKAHALVAMAETAIPRDAGDYLDCLGEREREAVEGFLLRGRRVYGQTQDELRRAGIKIVESALYQRLAEEGEYWEDFRIVTNEPRHLIRSMEPSVSDVIFGERLGVLAVDNAMAGYTDFMISQWLTEYVLVPLELVVLGRKRVPRDGIFWKTVVASTGQEEEFQRENDSWPDWWAQAERELRYSKRERQAAAAAWADAGEEVDEKKRAEHERLARHKGGLATVEAHQAAENALKAVVVQLQLGVWGHFVAKLLVPVVDRTAEAASLLAAAGRLDEYYLPALYPSRFPRGKNVTLDDVEESIRDAEAIFQYCQLSLPARHGD
jgi:6-phosphofructokinase/HEPN domain-containing protein